MENKKMTVTEALNALKLMDKKIDKATFSPTFVGAAKEAGDKIGHKTKATFEAEAKAGLQSVIDLIAYRDKVKAAIVLSNATTTLNVGQNVMTVAEAIEKKASIQYKKVLLEELTDQYHNAKKSVDNTNSKVDAQVDKLRETYVGSAKDAKLDAEGFAAMSESYQKQNYFALVDPCNILSVIEKLQDEINDFESNVNTALVISNATTFIEV